MRLLQKVTTRKKLLSETEKLVAEAGDHDTLLFFFSGHGFGRNDAAGNPVNYILPATADPADLEATAVSIDEVATLMKGGVGEALPHHRRCLPQRSLHPRPQRFLLRIGSR